MKSIDPGILPQSVCFSFTPSETAKQLYFYPTWCGHYFCNKNYFMKREFFPPLLIVFVRKGVFHFEYRNTCFDAQKGDVVLLDCSEPHHYYAENGLEFVYMHFDGSNSHEICQHILEQRGPLIQSEYNMLIGQLLYNMVDFYARGGIETMFQSSARIYKIFEYLLSPSKDDASENQPVEKVIRYIRSNIGKDISLDEMADIANLSTFYLAHLFKQRTGFAPKEYLINTRLDQAKVMLARTTKTIAEIAYEVGYSSSSSFNNMFVKRTDMSPRQYRQMYQR